MTKLSQVSYKGFAIGFRVGDRLALDMNPSNVLYVSTLHALKNLAVSDQATNELGLCSIDGVTYRTAR